MPSEPSAIPKSTTEARVTLASGPAAIAEARKNKKRMKEADQVETYTPLLPLLTPATTTVTVPAEAVINNNTATPSYPQSEASTTPSPIPMPPLFDDDDSSPLSSPSTRAAASITPRVSQSNLQRARSTTGPPRQTQVNPGTTQANEAPNQSARDTPTAPEDDVTMTNPPDRPLSTSLASIRSLVERVPREPNTTGRYAARDPLDNFTNAVMPKVHDDHPTSLFQFIDLDLISEWELLEGGKLLIIPFGDAPFEPKLHDLIKNRLLFAITEITSSQGIGISAPTPSAEAIKDGKYPSSFLVYNLTFLQKQLLLERGVWSSQAITFRATPFYPTNPDYLFTIKGFSLNIEDRILALVHNVWHDGATANFARDLVHTAPERDRTTLAFAIHTFLDSVSVSCLNIKERGGGLIPSFNVYANGNAIPLNETWIQIRKHLSEKLYYTPLTGRGDVVISPYTCGICHGVEHPKGLCPFLGIVGWNGPGKDKNADNRRGRNGGRMGAASMGAASGNNKGTFRM